MGGDPRSQFASLPISLQIFANHLDLRSKISREVILRDHQQELYDVYHVSTLPTYGLWIHQTPTGEIPDAMASARADGMCPQPAISLMVAGTETERVFDVRVGFKTAKEVDDLIKALHKFSGAADLSSACIA